MAKTMTRIADLLEHARDVAGRHDEVASMALRQSVTLLRAALPFQLPIPILTGRCPDTKIECEDSREPYAGILARWYSELLSHSIHHIEIMVDTVGAIRGAVDARFWNHLEGMDSLPLTLRKRTHAVSDLTDVAMTKWLSAITLAELSALATRWSGSRRANDKPSVLEELGLTQHSMLDLPDADVVRLGLLERLEAEERERSAELCPFMRTDDIGRNLERIIAEVAATFVVTHGKQ